MNIKNFLVDLISIDNSNDLLYQNSKKRLKLLVKSFKNIKYDYTSHIIKEKTELNDLFLKKNSLGSPIKNISVFLQTWILLQRNFKNLIRDRYIFLNKHIYNYFRMIFLSRFLEAILMSIILGGIFYKLGINLEGIRSRISFLYIVGSLQPYLILIATILQCIKK